MRRGLTVEENQAIPSEHKKLINFLVQLPRFSVSMLWTFDQKHYLEHQKRFWRRLGLQIDYLQLQQLGFCPTDPAAEISVEDRKHLEVYSNYLFALLQVCIANKELLKSQGQQLTAFPFRNPRELFAAICKECAENTVNQALSCEIGKGATVMQLRSAQSTIGKLYRGSLPQQQAEELQQSLLNSGLWFGFVIATISNLNPKYLKKQHEWREFQKAQKQLAAYLRKPGVRAIRWNGGYSIWAEGNSPILPAS